MYLTWALQSYSNIVTNVKTSKIFIWRNLFGVIVLNQNNSKDLFDFGRSFQRVFSVP